MPEAQTVESEIVEAATVDVAAAAVVLGVNKQTIYEAIKRGDQPFPIIRLGDRILIPRQALDRLVGGGAT
jgi:excisionase family DNA binding protein